MEPKMSPSFKTSAEKRGNHRQMTCMHEEGDLEESPMFKKEIIIPSL
jgi:hypothetical protein